MRIAVYPGTFDPPTNGHIDITQRALHIFDRVIIAVSNNRTKKPLFTINERIYMLKEIFRDIDSIEICKFDGLLIDFVRKHNATAILRGLRAVSDFEYELQLASFNYNLDNSIETVFLMARDENLFLSSSIIKEIASLGGDVSNKVHQIVWKKLKEKFNVDGVQS